MNKFNPDKLKVSYKNGMGIKEPITPRKYTLTHSDETAELFLTISSEYDFDSINYNIRDEVIGQWINDNGYKLVLLVELDNNLGMPSVIMRDKIFREELPLAITAIVFGDNLFLDSNKALYEAPIIIKFNSKIKEYNCIEEWGKVEDYKYYTNRDDNYYSYDVTPFPILPPIQNPYYNKYAKNKKVEKFNAMEKSLLLMLDPYISREVYSSFGKDAPYCLRHAEILEAKTISEYGPCSEECEVVVGLRVGKKQPFYNNMIITFVIDKKGVKVKLVKNPRNCE